MSSTFKYAEVVASVTSRVKQSNVITAVSVWEGCSYQFELLLIVLIVRYDIFPSYESFPLLHPRKRIQQRAVCFILVGEDPRAASQSQELPECMATWMCTYWCVRLICVYSKWLHSSGIILWPCNFYSCINKKIQCFTRMCNQKLLFWLIIRLYSVECNYI